MQERPSVRENELDPLEVLTDDLHFRAVTDTTSEGKSVLVPKDKAYQGMLASKEDVANKKTEIEANKTSDLFYASIKAVYDFFQAKLVSGTNIKTINSNTVLGSGDITTEYRPTTTTVTLTVAGWSGGTTQVATVTGATATNRLRFRLPSSDEEIVEIASKQIRPTPSTQTTNALTFVCTTTPTVEISMVCEILPAL